MTPEQAAALRAPFAPELVGKLPRIWCGSCRDARGKVCSEHSKTKCSDCSNKITTAHLHLDYIGHADATDRLLQVDPQWTWEPVGTDPHGLPVLDGNGGLWLRLTVCGVSRLGYGHADGKRGGDAVKEAIGDALRNAALRFGVALDLWRKEKPPVDDGGAPAARRAPSRSAPKGTGEVSNLDTSRTGRDAPATETDVKRLQIKLREAGYLERQSKLDFCGAGVGRTIASSKELTRGEVAQLIGQIETGMAETHDEPGGPA